jgi:DNA-binding NtrC family response regulator
MPHRVLVIDDDASLRFTLEAVLSDAGLTVDVAPGGAAGLAAFEARGADVVLTDLAMPDVDGMQVLTRIRAQDPSVPVLMLTAHGSERVAVAAMKAGAYDYLPKPFDPDELVLAVKRGIETRELRLQNARLRTETQLGRTIVAESPAMRRVLDMITRVAPKDVTVLITGESGSGKDVMATALHAHSRRAEKPFVRFNAAAIPSELAEAELFGHTKGAFTGAVQARQGYFQQADKGTLFIDEIGELPLAIQAKILRALQSGEVQQVGGRAETVDVRLVAATNRDLAADVKAGRFREDLFYRLNVICLELPPLRSRREDIPLLAAHFLKFYADENGTEDRSLSPEAMRIIMDYEWPGNVRELENAMERGVVLSTSRTISPDLLPTQLTGSTYSASLLDHEPNASLFDLMEEIERRIISDRLERCHWNQTEAAEYFKIPLSTLNQKIKRLNVEVKKRARD